MSAPWSREWLIELIESAIAPECGDMNTSPWARNTIVAAPSIVAIAVDAILAALPQHPVIAAIKWAERDGSRATDALDDLFYVIDAMRKARAITCEACGRRRGVAAEPPEGIHE